MKLVKTNPYRIAGILANATAKEIQSRRGKIQAFARVGKPITSEYDFSFLPTIERNEEIINKAFSAIEQNQDKVAHSLFWFIKQNPIDETAIQHLISGNREKAVEIWEKLTDGKEVSAKNFPAFNNIGTLYLLGNDDEEIKKGITAKIKLIESESFMDFVHTVADETFSIDTNKQIEILIDELLAQFKGKYSTAETMELFSNCNGTTQKYLSKRFTEEPVHKIEIQIEQTKNKRTKDKGNAYRFGTDLHNNTKEELTLLKSILGAGNLQYKMLADNVAKEILQCSIDYFNESQEQNKSNDYLAEAMKLARLAESVAINNATKTKIKESINTLEGMKERELNQAIEVLKSVKDAYETNKAKITAEVRIQEMSLGYGQSINWSNVNRAIEDSINWDKVVELIKKAIPPQHVEKIRFSDNYSQVSEFKSLAEFVHSHLNYSQRNELRYLFYWITVVNTTLKNSSSRTSTYKPISTASSNTESWASKNPGCLISIICFIIGGILVANEMGGIGAVFIIVGFFAHKLDN